MVIVIAGAMGGYLFPKAIFFSVYESGMSDIIFNGPEPLFFGKTAFETLDDSEAYVDDIVVKDMPPSP